MTSIAFAPTPEQSLDIAAIRQYLIGHETPRSEALLALLDSSEDPYSRSTLAGHITATTFILDSSMESALLIHHAALDCWVGPGGHVDSGEPTLSAAIRESGEEVGLFNLRPLSTEVFDLDIHPIPAAMKHGIFEPEHFHFDVRHLLIAEDGALVALNETEAKGHRWVSLAVLATDPDESTRRQALKAIEAVHGIRRSLASRPSI